MLMYGRGVDVAFLHGVVSQSKSYSPDCENWGPRPLYVLAYNVTSVGEYMQAALVIPDDWIVHQQ